jgi:hypothetical protein
MKRLGLLLSCAVCTFAQTPTVSNIHFDGLGDSSVRVLFDISGSFNAFRIRYGTSNTASGSGGTVQVNGTSSGTYRRIDMAGNVSGLAPGTTYYTGGEQ